MCPISSLLRPRFYSVAELERGNEANNRFPDDKGGSDRSETPVTADEQSTIVNERVQAPIARCK